MAYRPFCVEACLATPVAHSPSGMPPASLDGLLAKAVLAEKGITDAPVWKEQLKFTSIDLPLARVEMAGQSVWAGSIGFPVGPVKWQRFGWIKKWTGPRRWRGSGWAPPAGFGYCRNREEYFYCAAAPKLRFYGFGDPEAVLKLLRENILSLGHKHRRGFGRVVKWEVKETTADHSIWLQTKDAVYPARSLPLGAANGRQAAQGTAVVMQGTLAVPHWLREERENLLFPPPRLWQEGLADGDPDVPELNLLECGADADSVPRWLSSLCAEKSGEEE